MGSEWPDTSLDEVTTLRNGAGVKQEFFSEKGIPLARVSDFTQDSIDISDCKFVEREHAQKWKSHFISKDDVIVATVGSWPPNWSSVVGKVVRVPQAAVGAIQNQNTCCILPNAKKLDNGFLFYRLKLEDFAWHAANSAGGSANQARLPVKKLSNFIFNLPPLSEQKSIAHILGSLDDKIELNRQMNTTLESMAQALFKSWFVDFDPVIDNALTSGNLIPEPLHVRAEIRKALGEKCKPLPDAIQKQFPSRFVFSEEMGWIPEGWEVFSIYDLVDIIYGAPFKSKGFNSEDIGKPIIRIRDLKTGTPQCWSEEIHPKKTLIRPGDLVVGMDAEFRATVWYGKNGYLNQRLFTVKPKIDNLNSFFIQSSISPSLALEENAQVGTTVAHLGKKDIDKFRLLRPTDTVLALYELSTGAELKRWVNLHAETSTLTKLRDTLLPKLLSGQLRIPDAEKLVADAV